MTILDTHAWIWWTTDPKRLSRTARRVLETSRTVGIAAISCWEVAMLVSRSRIGLDRAPTAWMEQSLSERGIQLLPLTPAVAVRATQFGDAFQGDPSDRLIVATALVHGGRLVTRDERIRDSGLVEVAW